jgi:hypothetical protein
MIKDMIIMVIVIIIIIVIFIVVIVIIFIIVVIVIFREYINITIDDIIFIDNTFIIPIIFCRLKLNIL